MEAGGHLACRDLIWSLNPEVGLERESLGKGGSGKLGVPEEPSGHSVNWILGVLAQNVRTAAFARREWGGQGWAP